MSLNVSWDKGIECLGWRLPTEAEWDFAARGTKGQSEGRFAKNKINLPNNVVIEMYGYTQVETQQVSLRGMVVLIPTIQTIWDVKSVDKEVLTLYVQKPPMIWTSVT